MIESYRSQRDLWFKEKLKWNTQPIVVDERRIVLLVPHPEEEILACGGLLQRWAPLAREIVLVYVTEGGRSAGARRALETLSLGSLQIIDLGLRENEVAQRKDELRSCLLGLVGADDVLIAPFERDGHRDRDAIGAVAAQVADDIACELYAYPVSLWFRASPESFAYEVSRFVQIPLNPSEIDKKKRAIASLETKILRCGTGDLVPPATWLDHFRLTPFEVLLPMDRSSTSRSYFSSLYRRELDPFQTWSSEAEAVKREKALAFLDLRYYQHILEPACGNGGFTRELAKRCDRVTALDWSSEALEAARLHCWGHGNISWECLDITNDLPLRAEPGYDLLVVSDVLAYFTPKDREQFFAKLPFLLSPGAEILLVHGRDRSADYPSNADVVHQAFHSRAEFKILRRYEDSSLLISTARLL